MAPLSKSIRVFLSSTLLTAFIASVQSTMQYTQEIQIQSGRLRGFVETLTTKAKIRKYLGVPFARADRFEMPVAPLNWTGVKDMTSFGKVCYQERYTISPFGYKLSDMSEDCLNLNIYVPDNLSKSNLPVMVWIHGGGFFANSNRIADGSYLATIGEVILVTINYRLGTLGFLSAKEYNYNGNYGLFDQLEALKWVKNNIERFGGDSGRVTIFGNSAGGVSVSLLSLSPLAKGLFKHVIMQSGIGNNPVGYTQYQDKGKADKYFLENFNCTAANGTQYSNITDYSDTKDYASLKDCIKAVDAVKITDAIKLEYTQPVIDGHFLPDTPTNMLQYHQINPNSVLIGVADDDGSCLTDAIPALSDGGVKLFTSSKVKSKAEFEQTVGRLTWLSRSGGKHPRFVQAVVCKYSNPWTDFTNEKVNQRLILDILSDSFFYAPAVTAANLLSNRMVRTYFYEVKYGFPMPGYFNVPPVLNAYHETEKFMIFGFAFKDARFSYKKRSVEMMKIWTNFAKTGDPNRPKKPNVSWPIYNQLRKDYMVFKPKMMVKSNLRPCIVQFWEQDMRSLNTTISQICRTSGQAVPNRQAMILPRRPRNDPIGLY